MQLPVVHIHKLMTKSILPCSMMLFINLRSLPSSGIRSTTELFKLFPELEMHIKKYVEL